MRSCVRGSSLLGWLTQAQSVATLSYLLSCKSAALTPAAVGGSRGCRLNIGPAGCDVMSSKDAMTGAHLSPNKPDLFCIYSVA